MLLNLAGTIRRRKHLSRKTYQSFLAALLPMINKKTAEDVTLKYKVNLIVDHSKSKGAPVVVTFNPSYNNLIGEVEYDSEFGNLTTDFMKIKSGLFHIEG